MSAFLIDTPTSTGNQLLKNCIPSKAIHLKVRLSYVSGGHQGDQNPRQPLVKEFIPLAEQEANFSIPLQQYMVNAQG